MNRYFASSFGLHCMLAVLLMIGLGPGVKDAKTTYTIDFIGNSKVQSMQAQSAAQAASPAAAAPKEEVKKEVANAPEPKPAETKKAPKAYDSKQEISAKKQPKKKETPAPKPLAAPSVLEESESPAKTDVKPSGNDTDDSGAFEGGNIQTDFATFPYPWYITQVRNSLWSEWEKRRPQGVARSAMITFAIARDGKIKDLKVEKSSGDDSFDFSAKSAVINAGPFPPLPMLYEKDELTVTLELKQEK